MKKKLSLILLCILSAALMAVSVVFISGCDLFNSSTTDSWQDGDKTDDGNDNGSDNSGNGNTGGNNNSDGTGNDNTGGNNNSDSTGNGNTGGNNNSDGTGNDNTGGNNNSDGTGNGNTGGEDTKPHSCTFKFISKVNPTCTDEGYDLYKCSCGKEEKQNKVKALGHDYKQTVHKATCQHDWYMVEECSRCKDKKTTTVEGTKGPHQFGEYVSNNNATCGRDGTKTAKCKYCTATDTIADEGSATGQHRYGTYRSNNDATCQKNCTESATCSVCGGKDTRTVENSKVDHKYEWTVTEETCHSISKDGVCVWCGNKTFYMETIYDAAWHKYVWTETRKATCTIDGERKGTCSRCGETTTEAISATGHKDGGNGVCTVCGENTGVATAKIDVRMNVKADGNWSDACDHFGTVYFEAVLIDPESGVDSWSGKYIAKYDLYIVQSYVEGGKTVISRKKVNVRSDSMCTIQLKRVTDGSVVTFECNSGYFYPGTTSKSIVFNVCCGCAEINLIEYGFDCDSDRIYY